VNALGDSPSVHGLEIERFQDQEVECSLQEVGFGFGHANCSPEDAAHQLCCSPILTEGGLNAAVRSFLQMIYKSATVLVDCQEERAPIAEWFLNFWMALLWMGLSKCLFFSDLRREAGRQLLPIQGKGPPLQLRLKF
jgi:hypothetical protein